MGIFGESKKKDELVLLFNIGSSSVKGALFYTQKSGVPRVVASYREPMVIEEKVDIDRFLELTLKSLDVVAEKIIKSGLGIPTKVFCVLLSPWYISQTRVINLQKNTPFTFTSTLADSLIKKEISLLQEEYVKRYEHIGSALRPIELKNIKITLNGYETPKPLNKKTKELEMTIFVSMSAEEVCKKIEETIAKYFHFNKVTFSSFLMASFTVVRDLNAGQDNFLLINVGGEVTDIALVKHNALSESITFPLGINFMIRKTATDMDCSIAEAKSLISLFKDGHASEDIMKRLSPSIKALKTEWLTSFQKSLVNLSNDISIPAFVYITVDKDLADFFSEIIKTEQFNQYTLTESKFQIVFLSIENLRDIAKFEGDAIFNAFLTIDSVYINRFFS